MLSASRRCHGNGHLLQKPQLRRRQLTRESENLAHIERYSQRLCDILGDHKHCWENIYIVLLFSVIFTVRAILPPTLFDGRHRSPNTNHSLLFPYVRSGQVRSGQVGRHYEASFSRWSRHKLTSSIHISCNLLKWLITSSASCDPVSWYHSSLFTINGRKQVIIIIIIIIYSSPSAIDLLPLGSHSKLFAL